MNTTNYYHWGKEVNINQLAPIQLYRLPFLVLILFIAFTSLTLPTMSWAATITVNTTDDESNTDGDCSLREAIESANGDIAFDYCTAGSGDDTITLPNGTYVLTNASEMEITSNLTINGTSETNTIVKRDTVKKRVFKITNSATVSMDNLSIKDSQAGNVFVNIGATLTLNTVTISGGSSTSNGGGILNYGTTNLTNVTLEDNETTGTAGSGGAIYNDDFSGGAGTLNLTNVTIKDNSTGRKGGGIFNGNDTADSVTITNSDIIENSSSLCGAGIYTKTGDAVNITNSDASGNLYKTVYSDITAEPKAGYTLDNPSSITNLTPKVYANCYSPTVIQIDKYARQDDASELDEQELKDALGTDSGIVDADNLEGYQNKIEEQDNIIDAADPDNPTDVEIDAGKAKLKTIVEEVNTADGELETLADNNNSGGKTADEVRQLLEEAGVKNVIDADDNETEYLTDIIAATSGDIDTTAELQDLVDQANLDVISDFATNSDASSLTIDQLNVDTLENVDSNNLALYQAAIAADPDGFSTWAELQALIDEVNALATIEDYADNNNANSLTTDQLEDAGVSSGSIVAANLDLYKEAIANADPSEVDTAAELEALIESINDLADIQGYADNDNASALTIADLTDGGIEDTNSSYLDDYKAAIAAADASDITSWDDVQDIIDEVNASKTLETIQAYADAEDASAMTMAELEAGNLEGLDSSYLADYQAAIAAAGIGSISSWDDVQAIVDRVNALNKIKEAADDDDASNISVDDLNAGDLTDVDSGNLSEYREEIAASNESDVDTWAEVQTIIDRVNEEKDSQEDTTDTSSTSSGSVYYPADHYLLTISSPRGRAYTSPAGIDCDHGHGTCQKIFPRGTKITLHTEDKAGSVFDGWSGSFACEKASLVMNKAHTCTAVFHGDPNYVPPVGEEEDNDGNTGDGTSDNDGIDTGGNTGNNSVYVDSFSIRANIQGKDTCYEDVHPHPNDVVVAGFILEGEGSEQVLIRALDLEQGVNPKIIVKQTVLGSDGILRGVHVARNDAWELHASALDIPEFHKPDNRTDAALLLDLGAGAYTVTMCMSPNSEADSGVGLVTVMLIDNALTFSNVSGRGYVSGGANDAIVGFSVYGADGRKTAHIKGYALGEESHEQIDSSIEVGRIYFDPETNQIMGDSMKNVSSWREESSISHLPLHTELYETDAAVQMSFDPGSYTTILSSESGIPGLGIVTIEFID